MKNEPVQVYEGKGAGSEYPDKLTLHCKEYYVIIEDGEFCDSVLRIRGASVETITVLRDIAIEMESRSDLPKIEFTTCDGVGADTTYPSRQVVKMEFRPSIILIFRRH